MLPNAKKLRSGLVLGLVLVLMLGVAFASPTGSGHSGGGFIQAPLSDFSLFFSPEGTTVPYKFARLFSGNSLPVFQAPY
jgi:hypothetical protein